MKEDPNDHRSTTLTTSLTPRRPLLRASVLGAFGISSLAQTATAFVPGVTVDFKGCKGAFVTSASSVDALVVYYSDNGGEREAVYDIEPTTTDRRGYAPLVFRYNRSQDRTHMQLKEPRGSLVRIVAETNSGGQTARTNGRARCIPAGFNHPPLASFTATTPNGTSASSGESLTVAVGEEVTFTSTATDPDLPDDRLHYAWDLDGGGEYETVGQQVTTTYSEASDGIAVHHRVTDDFGASASATMTVIVEEPNREPAADFSWEPDPAVAGNAVSFTSTATDPDGSLVHYAWDFDGDSTEDASGEGVTHTFAAAGEYDVTHTVVDDDDATDSITKPVTVEEAIEFEQIAKLLASDGEAGDEFGYSVSVDGDTALVGALWEDEEAYHAGAAYMFTRDGGSWSQEAKLTASDAQRQDVFGESVSLDGDTALVGAVFEDENGFSAGGVYVFTRRSGTWNQQAKLAAEDGQPDDYFGDSVSLDGDTALIGASLEDEKGNGAGAAYVFTRDGGVWSQQAKLTASDGQPNTQFGYSVSIDDDTAIVGAKSEDENGSQAGAAYVFIRHGTTWSQQAKLTASDGETEDIFGESVSLDGDTALIAARGDDDNGENAGAAYVFTRSGTTWTQRTKLTASDGQPDDRFGRDVSLYGDLALVGAERQNETATDAGAVYVFTRSGTTWSQQAKLLAPDGEARDYFGFSVSTDGETILIGAYTESEKGGAAGAAYVFEVVT